MKFPFCRFVSLALLCITVSGCFESGFRLEQSIRDAVEQAKAGNTTAALNRLESLQEKHPENPDLAEGLGIVYQQKGDLLLASNYFQKAARLSPEKKYLQFEAAKNLYQASMKHDSSKLLKEYLESFPENGEAWLLLGRISSELNEASEAVDALTRGILLTDPADLSAGDHQLLGQLYLEIGDYPQADYYLNKAVTLADIPAIEGLALLGLVESSVKQGDWDVADVFLKRLESADQATYDSDKSRVIRQTVKEAQQARTGVYVNPEPEKVPAPVEAELEEVAPEALAPEEQTPDVPIDEPESDVSEAIDTAPEEEAISETTTEEIAEEPVAPEEAITEEEVSAEISEDTEAATEPEAQEPLEPYQPPEDEAELLLVNVRQLIVEHQYPKAIRMTWDSINKEPESALAWFLLSRAYSGYGQYLNAESAALEAVRLNPKNKRIVLNYLGTLQHSRDAQRFHQELLKVYQRFNKDSDIILALARSYARIMNDPDNAAALYRRFLDLEPDHEKAAEVRAEIPFVE